MHWILDSVKFGNRNGWDARETGDTAQCFDLELPMNLDRGIPSRARKSCTTRWFHPRFSVRVRYLFRDIIGHRTESLSHNWGCLVTYPLCVPLTGIRNPSLDSLSLSPSPHRIGKQQQHQQKVVFPKFQNVNRTALILGIKHYHITTKIDWRIKAWICKVSNYQSHE